MHERRQRCFRKNISESSARKKDFYPKNCEISLQNANLTSVAAEKRDKSGLKANNFCDVSVVTPNPNKFFWPNT